MADRDEVLEQARDWLSAGKSVALATVINTWGSAPVPTGSQLAVNGDGAFVGSVSGGCIEGAVVGDALASIEDGKYRILEFGVSDEQAWEVGLACGGDIRIHVAPAGDGDLLDRLIAERPIAQVTDLQSGAYCLVSTTTTDGELELGEEDIAVVRRALRDDKSRAIDAGQEGAFVKAYNPPQRLFLIGAVHISQALVPMAKLAGFAVTVIDPRGPFATEARFPDVDLTEEWPDEALDRMGITSRTAVVALTHDPKFDDPGLASALRSEAFYIGALGSRKTQAGRRERLGELGFGEEDFKRINGPVGLDLGATTPAEIAVSVLAEIIAAKHGKSFR